MAAFATVDDYELRQGELDETDRKRCEALLDDASAAMRSRFRAFHGTDYAGGINASFDDNAKAVCVSIVSRSLSVPATLAGVTQYSQTTGPYSASATYSNPTGELYIGKTDLKKLGLTGTRIRSIDALTWKEREKEAANATG
jgi:hypothetical protein